MGIAPDYRTPKWDRLKGSFLALGCGNYRGVFRTPVAGLTSGLIAQYLDPGRDILKARAAGKGINRIARELGTGSSVVRRVIEENL